VPADARLRAELTPQGEGLHVRLVVTPLGLNGPRLTPGQGRTHIMAAVNGEPLSADRDLALEQSHLEEVMDACPMLGSGSGVERVAADWIVDGAEGALALLELLPRLPAVAGIDWPKGQPISVDTAQLSQMHVRLHTGREWLELQGGIEIDEQMVVSLQTLIQFSAQGESRFVPLGAGRYLALTGELRARLQDLASVSQSNARSGGVQVPHVAANWVQATLEGSFFDADKAFGERLKRLADVQHTVPLLPSTLQAQFRPYQEEGYAWVMRLATSGFGAVLADDMGLGKTLQALAVLLARASGGPALVVAPTSLSGNWQAEARRFAPSLAVSVFGETERESLIERAGPGDVIVVSYQLMQLNVSAFSARQWHTLVVDEAQAIKNASTKRSQAVFELRADFRLALSGTPIENRLAELWSIMRVCNPGLLGGLKQFNDRFANPIERDGNRVAQRTLRRLISPFVLRRTKSEVLDDLPARTEVSLMVEPDERERAYYEALRRDAITAVERSIASDKPSEAHMNVLAQLTRLRRAACDPRLVSPGIDWPGAKVQAFGELAAELVANGHKALVFSQFVDFLTLLREPLDAAGIAYQYLDGSVPPAERTRRVDAFQSGEGEMFLISLKAGGFGLNLTVADYVVIADPWWNPATEDQASGRAHRIGQQRPVTVYRLVHKGTLEERIVALHQRKRDLADSVLEGGQGTAIIHADELVALIRGASAQEDDGRDAPMFAA
jgi:superfamily II DNA or RNA helicase